MKIYFNRVLTIFLLVFACPINAQEAEKNDFSFLDNIAVSDTLYIVNFKSEKDKFTLKICNNDTCATTKHYSKSITPFLLANDVISLIKKKLDTTIPIPFNQDDIESVGKLVDKIKTKDIEKIKSKRSEFENLLSAIDDEKDQYSGKLLLNKEVPYTTTYYVKKVKDTLVSIADQNNIRNSKIDKSKFKDTTVVGTETLLIKNAKIQFFNNKASSIYIEAELIISEDDKEKLIFLNNRFSVPLRYFNRYGSTVSVFTKEMFNGYRKSITIDYNDVFDYVSDQFFNYSVANDQVSLSNDEKNENVSKESKVIQRRFFDFFTAIIYSDAMGFNAENSNSLLNAQAKLLLPLSLINRSEISITRQFSATANIALNSSFQDESRFISVKDDEEFSNFDLLRKNNLYGKLTLDIFTYESKGWFLNTSLGYSAGFYRTGFRYTQTITGDEDVITEKQLLSVGHGPYLNFEIRPQTNFGADIIFSLEDLNYNDTKIINGRSFKDDIIIDGGKNHLVAKYNLINIEANFYWLTNPEKSKGGIYAKLGSYYHTESHSIFPQLMVGYATNLTSFVNRIKPKKEEKEPSPETTTE